MSDILGEAFGHDGVSYSRDIEEMLQRYCRDIEDILKTNSREIEEILMRCTFRIC